MNLFGKKKKELAKKARAKSAIEGFGHLMKNERHDEKGTLPSMFNRKKK